MSEVSTAPKASTAPEITEIHPKISYIEAYMKGVRNGLLGAIALVTPFVPTYMFYNINKAEEACEVLIEGGSTKELTNWASRTPDAIKTEHNVLALRMSAGNV